MDETIERQIRAYASERRFHSETVDRWLAKADEDVVALWELTRELRLGENQLRDLWDWAEEIAARDRKTIAAVFDSEPVRLALRSPGGRNDRVKALKSSLRRLRFPSLTKAQDRIGELVASMHLPPAVRFTVPDLLEGDDVRVEIVARNPAALAAAARSLADAASAPACGEIFELLSGTPDSSSSD